MEEKNNRIISIICSLLGGLIGTIPWILIYVYGGMIIAILAIFIAMSAWKGYNLAKGKIDKYVPTIIVIVSIISVTIATFAIIPALILLKEGSNVSIESIKELYEYNSFTAGIIKDYFISLLFTVIGISGVITNMKSQIITGKKVSPMNSSNITKEETEIMHNAFNKLDALNKYNAKEQSEILTNIDNANKEILFMKFLSNGIIKHYKGKYYYSEKAAANPDKIAFKKNLKVTIYIILILILIGVTYNTYLDKKEKNSVINNYEKDKITYKEVIQDNIIKYSIPSNWVEIEKYHKDNIYYYAPIIDKTGYSGIISIRYGKTEYSIDEFKKIAKKAYETNEDKSLTSYKINEFNNKLGYKVIEIITAYSDETYPTTEYMYYIFNDKTYGLVYLTDYYSEYVKEPKKVAYNIINDFDFIKGEVNYE